MKLLARRDVLRLLRSEERWYRKAHADSKTDERGKARADLLLRLIGEVKRMKVRGKR